MLVLVLLWNSITAVQTTDCPARVLLQALPSYSRRTFMLILNPLLLQIPETCTQSAA